MEKTIGTGLEMERKKQGGLEKAVEIVGGNPSLINSPLSTGEPTSSCNWSQLGNEFIFDSGSG